jgi:hypothetical protein
VTCAATDAAGNTGQCSFTVTVADPEPPTISCPPAIKTCVDPQSCHATVDLGQPMVTDNCEVIVTNDAPAAFPVGTTVVTWTACDPSGNCATCTQQVKVRLKAVFDPPITSQPFIGHWSPSGFTLRRYAVLPIPFHLADCKLRTICCDYGNVALKIRGPDRWGRMRTRTFSLANGKLRRFGDNCCYEAVFDTRRYSVKSGGRYTMLIKVNGLTAGKMRFDVW